MLAELENMVGLVEEARLTEELAEQERLVKEQRLAAERAQWVLKHPEQAAEQERVARQEAEQATMQADFQFASRLAGGDQAALLAAAGIQGGANRAGNDANED